MPPTTTILHASSLASLRRGIRLYPSTTSPPLFHSHTTALPTPLSDLPASSAATFLPADTAIYQLCDTNVDREALHDDIWRAWYPRRPMGPEEEARPRCGDSCWGRWVNAKVVEEGEVEGWEGRGEDDEVDEPVDDERVRGLVRAHRVLCERVRDVGREGIQGLVKEGTTGREWFSGAFVVVDRDEWEVEGVGLVVQLEAAGRHGLDGEKAERVVDVGDGEKWGVWRMKVGEAVKAVVRPDPVRSEGKAEIDEEWKRREMGGVEFE